MMSNDIFLLDSRCGIRRCCCSLEVMMVMAHGRRVIQKKVRMMV